MAYYSKKNGVAKKIGGRILSFLASAIGFTPPTGMSATNVQDAIEEVNTRVNASNNVSLLADTPAIPWTPTSGTRQDHCWYYKKGTKVSFSVGVDGPSAGVIYTLPVGYRPRNLIFLTCSGNYILIIQANGDVYAQETNAFYYGYIEYDAFA